MPYSGAERRIHRVFVTRNTEYHLRQDTCVGVRNRLSGEWLREHAAVHAAVLGSLRFFDSGAMKANQGLPQVGESLYFEVMGKDLVTSAVVSVERPRPETVAAYTA